MSLGSQQRVVSNARAHRAPAVGGTRLAAERGEGANSCPLTQLGGSHVTAPVSQPTTATCSTVPRSAGLERARGDPGVRSRAHRRLIMDAITGFLLYFVFPLWIAVGVADYLCHRATQIERTSGTAESVFHLAQLGQVGLPLLAGLLLELTVPILLLMAVAALVHTLTAWWDVAYSEPRRRITPFEQIVHGFLIVIPVVGVVVCGRPSTGRASARSGALRPSTGRCARKPSRFRCSISPRCCCPRRCSGCCQPQRSSCDAGAPQRLLARTLPKRNYRSTESVADQNDPKNDDARLISPRTSLPSLVRLDAAGSGRKRPRRLPSRPTVTNLSRPPSVIYCRAAGTHFGLEHASHLEKGALSVPVAHRGHAITRYPQGYIERDRHGRAVTAVHSELHEQVPADALARFIERFSGDRQAAMADEADDPVANRLATHVLVHLEEAMTANAASTTTTTAPRAAHGGGCRTVTMRLSTNVSSTASARGMSIGCSQKQEVEDDRDAGEQQERPQRVQWKRWDRHDSLCLDDEAPAAERHPPLRERLHIAARGNIGNQCCTNM